MILITSKIDMSYMSSPSPQKGSLWPIQSSSMYHVTKAIIIMMSSPSWPQGHHQVHGLHHQTDQASSWTSDHHHLNWTMGSTIKCNGSKPLARSTSSTSIIRASISIIWAPPHHQGPHGTISTHHVYKHQSSCIVL